MEQLWICSRPHPCRQPGCKDRLRYLPQKALSFLCDGAKVQRLRGAARISWEKLGSVLSALEVGMEIAKDQTSFGKALTVSARPENLS